jgi:hypothetical protein
MQQIITQSVHIFINMNRTESNEQNSFYMCLHYVRLKNFALQSSTVGAGAGAAGAGAGVAGAASKFLPGPGAA